MITINEKHTVKTFFMKEEYFPIKVCLNNHIDNIKYTQYEKDEYNMLELTLNKTTNEFYRLQLVIGNTFTIVNDVLAPVNKFTEGIAVFNTPEIIKTSRLDIIVYSNGVEIILSDSPASTWFKTGSILFGLNSDNELSLIRIIGLTADERQHILDELTLS